MEEINDKYKAITERLNFFARGLFEDVNAEGDRFGQFLGQNQESFLKNIFEIHPPAYFRMDVLKKPAIKTLDFFKSDFQFVELFFSNTQLKGTVGLVVILFL